MTNEKPGQVSTSFTNHLYYYGKVVSNLIGNFQTNVEVGEVKRFLMGNILLGKIKLKKREMYWSAKRFGFTDSRVVICSQDLDILLNRYQETMDGNFRVFRFIAFVNNGNGTSN